MRFRRKIRQVPEVLLLCGALAVIPLLPRSWILALSRGLGNVAHAFSRRLRRIALANLDVAVGQSLSVEEKNAIARDSFRTFALVLLDIFWFSFQTRERIRRYVRFDPSFDHYLETAPVIAVTAHLGNWEVMGQAAALHGSGSVSVAAPLENRFADGVLNRTRRRTGQRVVARQGAVRSLLRELRRVGRIALVMDQNVPIDEGGVFLEFLGLPTTFSQTAAALAARTDAPIVFVYCVHAGNGEYVTYALPPFPHTAAEGGETAATERIVKALEDVIQRHPGQWLWMYKRWKHCPADGDWSRFPFYAKKLIPLNK